jgi:hypothetical protein
VFESGGPLRAIHHVHDGPRQRGRIRFMNVATWLSSIGTLLAIIVALFKEELIQLWRRPELIGRVALQAPDCEKMDIQVMASQNPQLLISGTNVEGQVSVTGSIVPNASLWRGEAYYFRIWIENRGRQRADDVQVFAAHLRFKHADGIFRSVETFLPMNLRWSHSRTSLPDIFADINPLMGKHCDLGFISDPENPTLPALPLLDRGQVTFDLALEALSNTQSHRLLPGTYQLELRIAAANAKPVARQIQLTFSGRWYSDIKDMFKTGIGITDVS